MKTFRNWLDSRTRRRQRILRVRQHFIEKYPERKLVHWNLKEQKTEDGKIIGTVCYGRTKPPSRSWWIFHSHESVPTEISATEAEKLIKIPRWL
ncbi:MAG: hypothetical protein AAF558_08290 [Verrucomicrobiota bacterium]